LRIENTSMRLRGSFSPVMRSTVPTRDVSPNSCRTKPISISEGG
jgi:hypothetical protein